jgi:hypothetical protein
MYGFIMTIGIGYDQKIAIELNTIKSKVEILEVSKKTMVLHFGNQV